MIAIMSWSFLRQATVAGMVAVYAFAGANGDLPADGTYRFTRTDPGPQENIGSGTFSTSGSPSVHTMEFNPSSGSNSTWTKQGDGNYTNNDNPGGPKICFHNAGNPPYEYEYKTNSGGPISTGDVTN